MMYPAGTPGAAANPFDARRNDTSDPHREAVDRLRRRCFVVCVLLIVCAILNLLTFWVAYLWTLVMIGFSFTVAVIGIVHFRSMDTLENSDCCCTPLGATNQFGWLSIGVIVGGGFSFLTYLAAAIIHSEDDQSLFLAFAMVGLATSAGYVGTGFAGLYFGRRLNTACAQMETMRPPQWVAPEGANQAPPGPVVGVPIDDPDADDDADADDEYARDEPRMHGVQPRAR